ncbi:MAG: GNAT family N-acetyltransferase [Candidatus Adiutrix sp.]|jgi:ribosomal protein S18 acetylase RimI-like enzyme|nr:GNAT family N-acetyltransferase [Candidatus Adiutrix sp.]
MNNEISYFNGNETLIDDIEELWTELNQIHFEKSLDFKHRYNDFTFRQRKQSLLSSASKGKLFIAIAYDGNRRIGYCVSSIVDNIGEIDSIYVKPEYRKQHIGSVLMEKSLDRINSCDATSVTIKVAAGNEEAFGFYSKYGFKPIFTELQIATKPSP